MIYYVKLRQWRMEFTVTNFQLFIIQLTKLPINYIQSAGCDITASDYNRLISLDTDTSDLQKIFEKYIKTFKPNDKIRQNLIEYIVFHMCIWRKYCFNISSFDEKKAYLKDEIYKFINTLVTLVAMPNNKYLRTGEYKLLGIKPTWASSSRGQSAMNSFFDALEVLWGVRVSLSTIELGVETMLDEHAKLLGLLRLKEQLVRTTKEISDLKITIKGLRQQLKENSSLASRQNLNLLFRQPSMFNPFPNIQSTTHNEDRDNIKKVIK